MLIWRAADTGRLNRVCRPMARRTAAGLALAAAVAVALAAGWRYAGRSGDAGVGLEVVERSISATGSVKALGTVEVGSQLSGLISEMKADFNDGDLLAVVDRAPFEAKLALATANLAMARADIGLRKAAMTRARTRIAQDERDAARFELLSPKGVVTQTSREDAQTQLGLARADLAMAAAALVASTALVAPAFAHESRTLPPVFTLGNNIRLTVGFHVEPAFEDSFNAVDVILYSYDGACADPTNFLGKPLDTSAGDTVNLKVEALYLKNQTPRPGREATLLPLEL